MRKNKFLIFYLSFLLVLNSCGFQLRKPIQLDFKTYSIIGENSQITNLIDKQFSFSNIEKVSDSNADLIIEFIGNNYQKRILSLAGNGQIGEFELIQTIEYRVNLNGQWTEPRRLEAIREYTYDPTLYNAARAEEGYLKDSMIDQLSRSILIEISNLRE